MTNDILYIILGFALSLTIGRITIPNIIIVSKKKRLVDIPNERKVHDRLIPRLGGISFFPAILISYGLIRGLFWTFNGDFALINAEYTKNILFFLSGLMIIFSTGLSDDIAGLSYRRKILLQSLAAVIMVVPIGYISNLHGILGIHYLTPWVGIPLTIIVVLTIINAYNLIDGVDGLCSGLSSTVFITAGVWFYMSGNMGLSTLSACTLGVVLAFFIYNVFGEKLKIFMGDGGSLTMGYIISFLALQFITQDKPIINLSDGHLFMIALGMVFVPLFDTTRVFISRISKGKSPFHPDKTHIHHKLLRLGFSHIRSTVILITIQGFYILINIFLTPHININLMLLIDLGSAMLLLWGLNKAYSIKKQKQDYNLNELQ